MAWIDCLIKGKRMGRGVLMRGEHARLAELQTDAQKRQPLNPRKPRRLNVPVTFPNFALNNLSIRIFNALYYATFPNETAESIVNYDAFFYPLDAIINWNRIYGKRGFTQYQFILPKSDSRDGMAQILQRITESGRGSFMAVLKLYGRQNGYLPFAMDGYALALDFPIMPGLFEFLDELDEIVLAHGGRLYLTKDVRMDKKMFMQSYPSADEFINHLKDLNQNGKFRSFQSDRVGITK